MASALYGTVVGSLVGGWPADRWTESYAFMDRSALHCRRSGIRLGPEWVFIAARFIGGLGIGISTVVAPMYIAEMAPPQIRGRLAGMFQFNIVYGILIALFRTPSSWQLAKIPGAGCWVWLPFHRSLCPILFRAS
jgi:SP family arabinose:H+ symporter-like MFS transporter